MEATDDGEFNRIEWKGNRIISFMNNSSTIISENDTFI